MTEREAKRMLPRDRQLAIEYSFSRKHIDRYIEQELREVPENWTKVQQGIDLLEQYRSTHYEYEKQGQMVPWESKNARVAQLADLDLEQVVLQILVGTTYCQIPELFTSVTAQLAGRLHFDDKEDSIRTVAEMVAVLCHTDAYDISQTGENGQLMIQSRVLLSTQLKNYIEQSVYLPPMVCEPEELTHNYQSAYLTHNDCLVLGKGNGHDGDLCLDVLNKQNRIPLKLDLEFLTTVEEEPTFDLDTPEKIQEWDRFKLQSYQVYRLIAGQTFYLTNKVDKRGRIYAQGYHITTQGSAFKKAMVDFAEAEVVEGVPGL
jgi:hypothetical protein